MDATITTPDRAEFEAAFSRHRRELHVHCYRMLGSLDEADDLAQETFLRAWRKRETFAGRASFRAWLYGIATNACLDALAQKRRRPTADGEVLWLQPYPDRLLDEPPAPDAEAPDAVTVAKETIELAYLVAIQHLSPQGRAVLVLRDVLGWPARDVADLLDTTVAAVNSALQRAHATLGEHLPERRSDWNADAPTAAQRALLQRYVEASERGDAEAFVGMLTEDARFTMPPQPGTWRGNRAIVDGWIEGDFGSPEWGDLRCEITAANGQPAVANWLRKPGEAEFRLFAVDVLRLDGDRVADVVAFSGPALDAFGLPATLS